MKYDSEKMRKHNRQHGFSLIETVTSVIILALISSSVFVVISRNVDAAADSKQKMRAFEVARDKMEQLLTLNKIEEQTEYGFSETYPDIEWKVAVESFYEPQTDHMWARAFTSAQYVDTNDVLQKVELTHWLTDLSKKEVEKILEQQRKEQQWLEENPDAEPLDPEEPDRETSEQQKPDSPAEFKKPDNMSDELWEQIKKLLEQ